MITNVLPLFHILRVHYEWEMDCFIFQGRISTLFRWGGHIFSRVFVTFLPAYSSAKIIKIECVLPELWSQMYCHVFFRSTVFVAPHRQCHLRKFQVNGWCVIYVCLSAIVTWLIHVWFQLLKISCLCFDGYFPRELVTPLGRTTAFWVSCHCRRIRL